MRRRPISGDTWERMRFSRNSAARRRRERLKAQGLCVVCGQPRGEFTLCDECFLRYRQNRQVLRAQRYAKGLCVICGKRPHRQGVLTCYACGLKQSDAALKCIRRRPDKDDPK